MVTHDLEYLDKCDRVLVLMPGGRIPFYGPSAEGLDYVGKTRWLEVYQAFHHESERDWVTYHSMEELIPVFERYRLQLHIEAHPYDFAERNDDAVQIVRGLNRPWISYCFCIPHAFHLSDGAGDMRHDRVRRRQAGPRPRGRLLQPPGFHAPLIAAAAGCELAGVVARSAGRRADLERDHPGTPAYDDLAHLAAARVDAGVPLTVYQNRRFDADLLTVRAVIDSGEVGRVSRFESRIEQFTPPGGITSSGGGILLDLGVDAARRRRVRGSGCSGPPAATTLTPSTSRPTN